MEKLLMLGTSYLSCEMVKYAKSLGVYTIVTDYQNPSKSIAKQLANEYWMINTGEVDILEKKCREEGVTAVICGVSEFCLEMCMELCKRLGFPCYCTPEAWHYSRDKVDFKKLCREVGAPVAEDYYISEEESDEEIDKVKLPVVVKPVDLSANRGISYCHTRDELVAGIKLARSMSKSSKLVVERMLHGDEWYSSYCFVNGEPRFMALNAMYAQPGEPKNCYTITTTATNHIEQYIKEIDPYIIEVLKKVGCREGYAWVQAMLDEDGHFYILEMGYRLDGDLMTIPYSDVLGYNVVHSLVDFALGKQLRIEDLPQKQEHAFVKIATGMTLFTNKGGVIKELVGYDSLSKDPRFFVENLNQVGEELHPYQSAGMICFSANNIDEMCELISIINDTVQCINENGDDMIIKYTDFDYLKKVYKEGLEKK